MRRYEAEGVRVNAALGASSSGMDPRDTPSTSRVCHPYHSGLEEGAGGAYATTVLVGASDGAAVAVSVGVVAVIGADSVASAVRFVKITMAAAASRLRFREIMISSLILEGTGECAARLRRRLSCGRQLARIPEGRLA
jgi:hypothetical protein